MASPMVRYRVVLGQLGLPRLAFLLQLLEARMTTVSSCTMMLAVMYGMMPSAKIDSCSSAPR